LNPLLSALVRRIGWRTVVCLDEQKTDVHYAHLSLHAGQTGARISAGASTSTRAARVDGQFKSQCATFGAGRAFRPAIGP
jgi:hypothetical protein